MNLTPKQQAIHERALEISLRHLTAEADIVSILMEVDLEGVSLATGKRSLFMYAVQSMNLSEPVAYGYIAVARKSHEVPALLEAIAQHKLSVSKATRIVSALNEQNAEELIPFACENTTNAIDFEVARRNPEARPRDRVRPISEDLVQLTVTITVSEYEDFKRAQALLAQKGKTGPLGSSLVHLARYFNDREDPVRKADRAAKKNTPARAAKVKSSELCLNRVPLTAAQKHAVNARDRGRCTYKDGSGVRCGADRWVAIHHIIPVSWGGGNEPENLTTLCWAHHDLVHQLEFDVKTSTDPSGNPRH